MDGEPSVTLNSTYLPENNMNEGVDENTQTVTLGSDTCDANTCYEVAVSGHVFDKTSCRHVRKQNLVEMKAVCCCDRQRIQYQQNVEFLRSQHQELVGNLHEEIDRLKRKNRGLL